MDTDNFVYIEHFPEEEKWRVWKQSTADEVPSPDRVCVLETDACGKAITAVFEWQKKHAVKR